MPVIRDVQASARITTLDTLAEAVISGLKLEPSTESIFVERRDRGAATGRLEDAVRVTAPLAESDYEQAANHVCQIVNIDAQIPRGRNTARAGEVASWKGEVVFTCDKNGKEHVLRRLTIELPDPNGDAAGLNVIDQMAKSMVQVFTNQTATLNGMLDKFSGILSTIEKLVETTAKLSTEANIGVAKYNYKVAKAEADARARAAESEASVSRAAAWADGFEGAAVAMAPVAQQIVSLVEKLKTQRESKQGESSTVESVVDNAVNDAVGAAASEATQPSGRRKRKDRAPTVAELESVFSDAELEVSFDGITLRGLISEAITTDSKLDRINVCKQAKALLAEKYSQEQRNALQAAMIGKLGIARAKEIVDWIMAP